MTPIGQSAASVQQTSPKKITKATNLVPLAEIRTKNINDPVLQQVLDSPTLEDFLLRLNDFMARDLNLSPTQELQLARAFCHRLQAANNIKNPVVRFFYSILEQLDPDHKDQFKTFFTAIETVIDSHKISLKKEWVDNLRRAIRLRLMHSGALKIGSQNVELALLLIEDMLRLGAGKNKMLSVLALEIEKSDFSNGHDLDQFTSFLLPYATRSALVPLVSALFNKAVATPGLSAAHVVQLALLAKNVIQLSILNSAIAQSDSWDIERVYQMILVLQNLPQVPVTGPESTSEAALCSLQVSLAKKLASLASWSVLDLKRMLKLLVQLNGSPGQEAMLVELATPLAALEKLMETDCLSLFLILEEISQFTVREHLQNTLKNRIQAVSEWSAESASLFIKFHAEPKTNALFKHRIEAVLPDIISKIQIQTPGDYLKIFRVRQTVVHPSLKLQLLNLLVKQCPGAPDAGWTLPQLIEVLPLLKETGIDLEPHHRLASTLALVMRGVSGFNGENVSRITVVLDTVTDDVCQMTLAQTLAAMIRYSHSWTQSDNDCLVKQVANIQSEALRKIMTEALQSQLAELIRKRLNQLSGTSETSNVAAIHHSNFNHLEFEEIFSIAARLKQIQSLSVQTDLLNRLAAKISATLDWPVEVVMDYAKRVQFMPELPLHNLRTALMSALLEPIKALAPLAADDLNNLFAVLATLGDTPGLQALWQELTTQMAGSGPWTAYKIVTLIFTLNALEPLPVQSALLLQAIEKKMGQAEKFRLADISWLLNALKEVLKERKNLSELTGLFNVLSSKINAIAHPEQSEIHTFISCLADLSSSAAQEQFLAKILPKIPDRAQWMRSYLHPVITLLKMMGKTDSRDAILRKLAE
ncbi:hypothetical protein [Paraburkholderia bonniea]|uniref:hypothetical protein n=1 Tax=Paraburkholderia bonniea TaxID=2152891 RepID=UPI001292B42C|nr:hypothetical protein [Paraburkholderia bonniea]